MCSYRCPSNSVIAYMNSLENTCLKHEDSILIGDLEEQFEYWFKDKVEDNVFAVLNLIHEEATTRPASKIIIDIAITNILQNRFKLSIIPTTTSDDSMIYISMETKLKAQNITKVERKLDERLAKDRIINYCENLQNPINGDSLNKAFKSIVSDCTKICMKKSNYRNKKPYITHAIIQAIRERDYY